MKSESDEILELEAALRGDLPSERDAARIRARLAGLGLGIGVTLTTAAALAGSKSTPAGLWGFLGSLPVGAKVGIATVVTASAVAGPVYYSQSHAPLEGAPATEASTRAAPRVTAPLNQAALAPNPALPAVELPAVEPVTIATELPPAPAPERSARSANTPPPREAPPSPPPVAATLGEETRLIDAALSALRRGDRATAGEFIRQHEQRFPDGLLRRERERARAALIEHLENSP
jgi:hypothetical protein